ncbi:MAG TPA: hypothetical protein VFE30_15745 [Anaeromyxobacteraceae bacterium]|nr:hypothetical protein [Anaeromyxobacteraceae bacterium]
MTIFQPPVGGTIQVVAPSTPAIFCGTSSLGAPVADASGVLRSQPTYYSDPVRGTSNQCQAAYPAGASVILKAVPSTGNAFVGWAGDCTGPDTCALAGSGDRSVAAIFAIAGQQGHTSFIDGPVHKAAFSNELLPCKDCHGPTYLGQGIAPGCAVCHDGHTATDFATVHVVDATCADCHALKGAQWASSTDLHHASAADVLTNVAHDTNELLVDQCLQCHSMFQRPLGIAAFVTPIDQVGSPAGTWTLLPGASQWQATRCTVCHDPTSSEAARLAKYGAVLDQAFLPAYTDPATWPAATQFVLDPAAALYVETPYPATASAVGVKATQLCYTCHDPADQGGDPDKFVGTVDYGPQGGDSRAFVTSSHAGITCVACHPTHDFTPLDPAVAPSCQTTGCHDVSRAGSAPGVVHVNHLP